MVRHGLSWLKFYKRVCLAGSGEIMKRVAVIGWEAASVSNDDYTVSFFGWHYDSSSVNLKDYHFWVLLCDTMEDPNNQFWQLLRPDYVHHALLHKTTIFVIGHPFGQISTSGSYWDGFMWWTGLRFDWDEATSTADGRHVEEESQFELSTYLDKIHKARFALEHFREYMDIVEPVSESRRFTFVQTPFIRNRYGRSIAFALTLRFWERSSRSQNWRHVRDYGRLVVLPPNSSDLGTALGEFLTERFSLSLREEPPVWILATEAPGQIALDEGLAEANQELEIVQQKISRLSLERVMVRSCLNLLYQTGPALEEAVLDALVRLGADVENPVEPGREDGWILVNDPSSGPLEGVLEIKGTQKPQFDSYGPKQLLEWVNRGIELRTKRYKPIFIGNPSASLPLDERANPFPDNWVKQAALGHIAALTSQTLFEAIQRLEAGTFDKADFWNRLFATEGVFSLD